jgi:ABC-type bacteriocin/lantibiotic exporter with double-glycine peptidase domain
MPREVQIVEGVPGYVQDRYQCGPSALASVAGYWRGRGLSTVEANADTIGRDIYSEGARGVLLLDLYFYAQDLGFNAEQTKSTPHELRALIDNGTPSIVLVDYGTGGYQINHFMVIYGYSSEGFVVHSGLGVRHISNKELERIWERAGYWSLIIKPL